MKLADSHLHLFRSGFLGHYGLSGVIPHELQLYNTFRRLHQIERGLVIGYEGLPRYRGNNRDLAAWSKKHPWITPMAYLALKPFPTLKKLQTYQNAGFVGFVFYIKNLRNVDELNKWPGSIWQWLNDQHQIISINIPAETLSGLVPLLARLQGCRILISHLGLPGRHPHPPTKREVLQKTASLRELAKMRNVGVKVSALYAISQPAHAYPHRSAHSFLWQLYDDFGPKRLYWGSDFSPALTHVSFPQTIDAIYEVGWSSEELNNIMYANLVHMLSSR